MSLGHQCQGQECCSPASSQGIIPLRNHSLVSLSPQVFHKMLILSEPTLTFKGQDCKQLLEKHDNGLDLLPEFLEDLIAVPEDITKLQVSSFRNPFREIAWYRNPREEFPAWFFIFCISQSRNNPFFIGGS